MKSYITNWRNLFQYIWQSIYKMFIPINKKKLEGEQKMKDKHCNFIIAKVMHFRAVTRTDTQQVLLLEPGSPSRSEYSGLVNKELLPRPRVPRPQWLP